LKKNFLFLIFSLFLFFILLSLNIFKLDNELKNYIEFFLILIYFLIFLNFNKSVSIELLKEKLIFLLIILGVFTLFLLKNENKNIFNLSFFFTILITNYFFKYEKKDLVKSNFSLHNKLLDTSSIIDGRIKDICKCNFLEGDMLVPVFIINEIQALADSSDFLKRTRGRRGLDILNEIQTELGAKVKIINDDFENIKEIDYKLIELAKKYNADIITNDFNLNKIAQIENIKVLNVNELSNAIKPIFLPGEKMKIKIIKEGKENNQGIGYLDDGTMIVIDNARKYINNVVEFVVTSSIQTSAGRMIFGKLLKDIK